MEKEKGAEERIYEAAQAVFFEKGYDGARMQEIADRAGINKSMLHYYFRSKDKLFEGVFHASLLHVFKPVMEVLQADLPIREKIDHFVHTYIDRILANPHVPAFVLHELGRHPDRLKQFVGDQGKQVFLRFAAQIEEAVHRGEIKPVRPEHVLVNLVGLCVFPFIARPMIEAVLGLDEKDYGTFLHERKREVIPFMYNALGL